MIIAASLLYVVCFVCSFGFCLQNERLLFDIECALSCYNVTLLAWRPLGGGLRYRN